MAERVRDHYEGCHGLHSDLAAGCNSGFNSIAVYEASFTHHVAPYFEHEYPNDYDNYAKALVGIEGLAPPGECPPIDRPAWGAFYTEVGKLYLILRKMNKLPIIVQSFSLRTPQCILLQLASSPTHNGVPADGARFQGWELQMIETMKPGGDAATLVEHEGKQYLVPQRLVDPFEFIQSRFYRLPHLPDLQPSGYVSCEHPGNEHKGHESETSEDEEFKGARTIPGASTI